MRKSFLCLTMILSTIMLYANGAQEAGTSAETEQIVLRLGELNPDTHPVVQSEKKFAEIVEAKSNGRIKVEIYSSGQLGDQDAQINQVVMGALDIFRVNPQFLNDFGVPVMKVLSLPYVFRSVDHAWNVLDSEIGTELLTSIDDADVGLIGLGWYTESARNYFFTDTQLSSVEKMKGLKLRVPPSNMYMETTKSFGANPTPIAYSELYNALQTGVVDGAENALSGYYANRFYEVAPYYTFDGHELSPSITLFSAVKWNKLSPEDQKLIRDSWKEAEQFIKVVTTEADKKIIEELTAKGIQFFEVDNKQAWIDSVQPLYTKYGEGYEDLISRIQAVKD